MMAHAWGRILNRVGVCMAASGPGTTNLVTGVANAWVDAAPLLAIGGPRRPPRAARPVPGDGPGRGVKPITKWAGRVLDPRRVPDMVATAFREARAAVPDRFIWTCPAMCSTGNRRRSSRLSDPEPLAGTHAAGWRCEGVQDAIRLLERAESLYYQWQRYPLVEAWEELRRFVELAAFRFTRPLKVEVFR